MKLLHPISWLALSAGALVATPVVAQQSDATQTDAQDNVACTANAAQTRAAAITGTPQASGDGEVIVTGTRIARPNLASASPITSVTAQDIKAQAPLNVEEVLNRLSQIAPEAQQNCQDSDGRQQIKLRSLGFERTLAPIECKRLGTMNARDTDIIPPSLLPRVDILSGGASSLYGWARFQASSASSCARISTALEDISFNFRCLS